MKIKKVNKISNKILKLKLIKAKIYKKNYIFKNLKIEDIEYRLKRSFQLIYKYHTQNKKIIFIDNSSVIEIKIKELLKDTKHLILTENKLLNGFITNKYKSLNHFFNQTLTFKKNNLIVILNNKVNSSIIKECHKIKIPLICLGSDLNIFNSNFNYKVPGNFFGIKKKIKNHFFLTLLKTILKKPKQIKNYKRIK